MDDLTYKAIPYFKLATDDEVDADPRVVKQIFSVTGEPDSVNDIIKQGAYRKTLKERPDRIKVLWQHNFTEPPIGVPIKLAEVGKDKLPEALLDKYPNATGGLYGEIKYLETPRGEEILQGIKAGAITENSIGFDLVKWKMDGDQKLGEPTFRVIEELRLWDVSPVNWGAHPATQNVKREPGQFDLLEFQDAINAVAVMPDDTLIGLLSELKAGRVLSAANLKRLKDALTTLNDILFSAEPPEDDDSKSESVENSATVANVKLMALTVNSRIALAQRQMQSIKKGWVA